jgi:response regulator of citrate/malate metabolism
MQGNKHILIVDDDAEFAGLVAEAVRDVSGTYMVSVSADTQAALIDIRNAQASSRSYDLVITDIKMPASSGLRLLQALSEISPETKTVTMTAYHSSELASQAQQLNVYAYLIKPIALSEFRQVVCAALSTPEADAEAPSLASQLSDSQKKAVEQRLAGLRAVTNSTAALLVHADGTVLAADILQSSLDASTLCEALIGAQRTIAKTAQHSLSIDAPIQQSYYGTESYGICTQRLNELYIIVTVFEATVREGHVWYQMREAVTGLAHALGEQESDEARRRARVRDDWQNEIEQYFARAPRGRTRDRRNAHAKDRRAARPSPETAWSAERQTATPRTTADPDRTRAGSETTPPSPDPAALNVPSSVDWDQASNNDGGLWEEVAREQAQDEGLYNPRSPSAVDAGRADRPSIEDINWEISTDLDWEEIVQGADQGFGGLSLDEARNQGLVDDLEAG